MFQLRIFASAHAAYTRPSATSIACTSEVALSVPITSHERKSHSFTVLSFEPVAHTEPLYTCARRAIQVAGGEWR